MLARRSYKPAIRLSQLYSTESVEYCKNLVRENDYGGYLSCLLFPKEQRDASFAILAFSQEMKSIRQQCNNNRVAGRMRYLWWRGLLEDIYINAHGNGKGDRTGQALSQHPVVEVLSENVKKYSLTKRWLERILEVLFVLQSMCLTNMCFLSYRLGKQI